jgi:hypothetical protein
MKNVLPLLLLSIAGAAFAGSMPGSFVAPVPDNPQRAYADALVAIERLAATELERWAYTRTMKADGRIVIDRHDPDLPGEEHWQLVSVDGMAPSEEDWRDYRRKRADHSEAKKSERRYDISDLATMLVEDSLQAVGRDGQAHTYRFLMRSPDGKREKLYAGLTGEFTLNRSSSRPFIERVRIWSDGPISPALGVRLESFGFEMRFNDHGDHVLPETMDLSLEGRAFVFKDLDNEFQVAFTDLHKPF